MFTISNNIVIYSLIQPRIIDCLLCALAAIVNDGDTEMKIMVVTTTNSYPHQACILVGEMNNVYMTKN